jgi:multiple sugar transport system substrate-binding protein
MFNLKSSKTWIGKAIKLFLIAAFLVTSGFGCSLQTAEQTNAIAPITLKYWRVWDDQDAFDEIIADYQVLHPNITIEYRKFKYEEFEQELLDALAEDRGPDIFSIPEAQLLRYQAKIAPMPAQLKVGYVVEKNYFNLKTEKVVEIRTQKTPILRELKDKYIDTVVSDAMIGDQLYGLPLAVDTLVMFYNKDIINQAGITQLPTDWTAFQEASAKATKFASEDQIIQSGTALGTGFNVERAFDIISILMMQSGAQMVDSRNLPTFFASAKADGKNTNPGLNALQFYADFASPIKNVYSWNNAMPNSLEAFLAGKVGFFFGYNYQIPQIRSRSRVNFGIVPLPQISGRPVKNYANYWLETVSKKSAHQNEAWDFILFMNQSAEVKKYLAKTNHSTAQKALITDELDSEDLNASASQLLTATTWYRGYDASAAEQVFKEMAEQFLLATEAKQISNVMSVATQKITQTINAQ